MEEERLWKFRRPEWLNSVWARNAGVYGAGAIVRLAHYHVAVELFGTAFSSLRRYKIICDFMRQLLMMYDLF